MSYYYKYSFVSPESIYALVQEELKSYFDSGAVDSLLFPTWTDKCLKKLGRSSYKIKETVLPIEGFTSKLPEDFFAVREARMCTCLPGVDYTFPNSTYQECIVNKIPVSSTNDANCNPCYEPPGPISVVYKYNQQTIVNQFSVTHLLKPGNISAKDNCSLGCANLSSTSLDTFDIRGNKFVTNFRDGDVYLIYYAKEVDINGYQLIPDNYRIQEYIEAFIKYKIFEQLFNQVTDETYNQIAQKYQLYKQLSDEAFVMAETEIKKETVQDIQRAIKRVKNINNKYELINTYSNNYYGRRRH